MTLRLEGEREMGQLLANRRMALHSFSKRAPSLCLIPKASELLRLTNKVP